MVSLVGHCKSQAFPPREVEVIQGTWHGRNTIGCNLQDLHNDDSESSSPGTWSLWTPVPAPAPPPTGPRTAGWQRDGAGVAAEKEVVGVPLPPDHFFGVLLWENSRVGPHQRAESRSGRASAQRAL